MESPENKLLDIVKFWMPRKNKAANVSRDFWMPDQSCRVCYECDSQFTVFNRKHHCRLCGRVFCAKCTAHSIPIPSDEPHHDREEFERIRVCNYCFKQWEKGLVTLNHEAGGSSSPGLSPTASSASLGSINSSFTGNSSTSTAGSMAHSTGPYEHVLYSSGMSPEPPSQSGQPNQGIGAYDPININTFVDVGDSSTSNHYGFCANRGDDEENANREYYGAVNFDEIDQMYGSCKGDLVGYNDDTKAVCSMSPENFTSEFLEGIKVSADESGKQNNNYESDASLYGIESAEMENLDFENNGLLWIPPEPEDEDDDREVELFEDEDERDAIGEWGYPSPSSSFTGRDLHHKEKYNEEHRRAMRNVVGGHFRALITQLLQVEHLPISEECDEEGWLDIITSLAWEAASLLKPDMSKGSGMDPGGYVKVKCLACGKRSDSFVVKGVVCKKNVAHRRMISKIDRPRLLILGGALEYQRVSNHLSSFDTLLQQEMDHLKMAVAKISAHYPNILLVEKSVSRFAQEYLLAKNISLVLNIKRPLLERIARCTDANIVPSIDHLKSQKLGYCDIFHVEKYLEEHGSAGQGGKKLTKTLMFFEGCPKPLGCTILLKGAPGDELKKVKYVVQCAIFAAYHLALETSYLADEGASLPELPLKSPIVVALPDKPLSTNKSISTIHDLISPTTEKSQSENNQFTAEQRSNSHLVLPAASLVSVSTSPSPELSRPSSPTRCMESMSSSMQSSVTSSLPHSASHTNNSLCNDLSQACDLKDNSKRISNQSPESCSAPGKPDETLPDEYSIPNSVSASVPFGEGVYKTNDYSSEVTEHVPDSMGIMSEQSPYDQNEKAQSSKEDFPPSLSDTQSILVSLTTRCVLKGVVCERAHLLRIKYYRSFDKPLGRFLQYDLFDQSYRCRSCEMPSEAHIHCYTHQQGSLIISVRKLTEFLLPGEREGKIWMWHRCLRCPRIDGSPPATRRVVMSDAAWGLSFGKFLELSFSNHAAASRVASCGHSLHKDCLRFYGCGRMIACFRYAPIIVHAVYLPPSKLEFDCDNQEWIEKEASEVSYWAELLFTEVRNAMNQISEKLSRSLMTESSKKACGARKLIGELERILKKEKEELENSLQKTWHGEGKAGQSAIDILELNRLRQQLLFLSYLWDQRLIYVSSLQTNMSLNGFDDDILKTMEELNNDSSKFYTNGGYGSVKELGGPLNSVRMVETNCSQGSNINQGYQLDSCNGEKNINQELRCKEEGEVLNHADVMSELVPPKSVNTVQRVISNGQFPMVANLSDTLDAAWTGKNAGNVTSKESVVTNQSGVVGPLAANSNSEKDTDDQSEVEFHGASGLGSPTRESDNLDNSTSWLSVPFSKFYQFLGRSTLWNAQKLATIAEYNPIFVLSFRELERQVGAMLLLPVGANDTVVPVYDDEPTSIIAYALVSPDYQTQLSDDPEMKKDGIESAIFFPVTNSGNFLPLYSPVETASGLIRSFGSSEESLSSLSGSRNSVNLDPLFYTKALHARISFAENGPHGKVKYTVTCYYAKRFEALRKICCPSELDFIRSLSRCKKWGAQGGKSNVFFAKTLDDRFIIKQVTKTELESFIKFAPAYFKYLSEAISTRSPTCLAKILGIYQVTSKHLKGGRESKMDVLVMENLLYRRNVTRLYDLKGSCRSRYNPDCSGGNKVLLDQNLIETMPTSPIFVGNKAKRLLERAVWNDTSFLSSIDVMDYSLLVGVDEERHELVVGIIDFMRQYTWDKHLETWVKASGILGGPKNASPTVISPDQYKKRFRKAMSTYFIMVPDQWSPPTIIPSRSLSDLGQESSKSVNPSLLDHCENS